MDEKKLKQGWFVVDSPGLTLKNIIEAADPQFLRNARKSEFKAQLLREVGFLPIPEQAQSTIKTYMRQNGDSLYLYSKKYVSSSNE